MTTGKTNVVLKVNQVVALTTGIKFHSLLRPRFDYLYQDTVRESNKHFPTNR